MALKYLKRIIILSIIIMVSLICVCWLIDLPKVYIVAISIALLICYSLLLFFKIYIPYRNTLKILATNTASKNASSYYDINQYIKQHKETIQDFEIKINKLKNEIKELSHQTNSDNIILENQNKDYKEELKKIMILIFKAFYVKEDNMTVVGRMSIILDEIYDTMKDIVDKMNNQSRLLALTFDAFDMTTLSLEKVDNIIDNAKNLSSDLLQKTDDGMEALKKSKESMLSILQFSEQMANIITTIEDIAEKTNLLSINVSIESSHTGKSGKGFAIIAREIRKLANNTQRESVQIKHIINNTIKRIKAQAELIEMVYNLFTQTNSYIEKTNTVNRNIYKISKQGVIQGKEIQTAVNSLDFIAKKIISSSNKELFQINEVINILKSFKNLFISYKVNRNILEVLNIEPQISHHYKFMEKEKQEKTRG